MVVNSIIYPNSLHFPSKEDSVSLLVAMGTKNLPVGGSTSEATDVMFGHITSFGQKKSKLLEKPLNAIVVSPGVFSLPCARRSGHA